MNAQIAQVIAAESQSRRERNRHTGWVPNDWDGADRGPIRLTAEDPEANYVKMIVFEPGLGRLVDYEITFQNAPVSVIVQAIIATTLYDWHKLETREEAG